MPIKKLISTIFLLSICLSYGQGDKFDIRTIAFYNVENLFDTINDPKKFDDDRTPDGKDKYTSKIYWDKIDKLSRVLSEIGMEQSGVSPAIIGVCEVENYEVLKDLVASDKLKDMQYDIIHFDSPDERGIDVALLYRRKYFKPLNYNKHELLLFKENGMRDYTRDQLVVSGLLDDDLIHIIVNHWPSRSGGEAKSRPFRIAAANLNNKIIDSLQTINERAKIITMGDLNDDPDSPSIKKTLNAKEKKAAVKKSVDLYNPMANMHRRGMNTLVYRDQLFLFDQIIVSQPLLEKENASYRFYKAGIYNKKYLITEKGPFKNYPFRSYHYNTYQGGYSDHFPVYIYLIKDKE